MAGNGLKRRRAGDSLPDDKLWARSGCCDAEETVFRVRVGPNYKRTGAKAQSGPSYFVPVGMDMFRTPAKTAHIAQYISLPDLPEELSTVCNGIPPYYIVNVQLPDYEPTNPLNMFSNSVTDGPGWSVVLYFLLKPETRSQLQDLTRADPALRLLKDFIENDDEQLRTRFKAIGNFLNPDECGFSYAVRKLLNDYNMKPVLTRPQHTFHTDHKTYFETDIDVHIFGYIGRKGFAMAKTLLTNAALDVGFVIEARTDEEMPETVFATCHLHGLPMFSEILEQVDFQAERNMFQQGKRLPPISRSPGSARKLPATMYADQEQDLRDSVSSLGSPDQLSVPLSPPPMLARTAGASSAALPTGRHKHLPKLGKLFHRKKDKVVDETHFTGSVDVLSSDDDDEFEDASEKPL